jgi:hypothetical protein
MEVVRGFLLYAGMKHYFALVASRLNTHPDREQGLAVPVRDKPGNQGVM